MPAVTRMEGCLGFSLVVERQGGRCIATSSWTSQEAMTRSDDLMAPHRAYAGRMLGGRALVEEWDVALMHRDHASMDGAACRITWAKCSDVHTLVEAFGSRMLPVLDRSEGFCSTSIFVDKWAGRACITVTFDSRRALAATRARAEQNRLVLTELADVAFEEVLEFELVLAHLRVPELV
jgi:hypothetical protein